MSSDANTAPNTSAAAVGQGSSVPPVQSSFAKPAQSGTELGSILAQVQALQADRERLQKELEESHGLNEKLQEGKRMEMQKMLDTVIAKWLADSVENEDARKSFVDGMDRLVKGTKENNGIWQVACQASNAHARRLEELERLRVECTTLKEQAPGARFVSEDSRKRARDPVPVDSKGDDVWSSFEYTGAI